MTRMTGGAGAAKAVGTGSARTLLGAVLACGALSFAPAASRAGALAQLAGAARGGTDMAVELTGAPWEGRAVNVALTETELDDFIRRAVAIMAASPEPQVAAAQLRQATGELLSRAGSPGMVMTLMILRDKNIGELAQRREAELFRKLPAEERARQAAEKLRGLAAEERAREHGRSPIALIREVSIEKDFLGRPRLRITAPRLDETRECRSCKSDKVAFEDAIEWNFSDDPRPHPMHGFGIGYRLVYEP